MNAPYSQFGKTRDVEVRVYVDGRPVNGAEWDEEAWIEHGEDWYGFMSPQWSGRRVRVVTPDMWRRAA